MAETPVWITAREGFTLNVTEASSERCEVRAYGLPADRTSKVVMEAIQATIPQFKSTSVTPGYYPVAYQLEAVIDGSRYVLHFEGADDGAPGHALRASLLSVYVLRLPASGAATNVQHAPPQLVRPTKGLTVNELVAIGGVAIDALCLGTRLKDQVVGDWAPESRGGFHPATAEERAFSFGSDSDLPVWASETTGSLVTVTERSPDQCAVSVFDVPPDEAARLIMATAMKMFPDLKPVPITTTLPGKAYQLEKVSNGSRYVLRLEAGKSGVQGDGAPTPYLMAFVVRQPASAPSPFP